MGWQKSNIGKKPYLKTYQGGGDPTKYEIIQNTVRQLSKV